MPELSILIPVYNNEKYLPRCLDSVLAQTWKDYEVIVVDDGSTDSSYDLAKGYAAKDPRVRAYRFENKGVSASRNRALDLARGEWLMFVDSDDYIKPKMAETLLKTAHDLDAQIVECGLEMKYGPFSWFPSSTGRKCFDSIDALKHLAKGEFLYNYPYAKLTKKECYEGVRFPVDVLCFEDTRTVYKTIAKAKRVATIPDRFYCYVRHAGSLTHKMSLEKVYDMRQAFDDQKQQLALLYPQEQFDYDVQYYNADMVIIYTLILFCHRRQDPRFVPADIDWRKIPFGPVCFAAYEAWLGIAILKLSDRILKNTKQVKSEERR